MCGRFTMAIDSDDVRTQLALGQMPLDWEPRYNIAPLQTVPVVRQSAKRGKYEVALMRWGLVPSWADDPKIGNRMINARAEGIEDKPSFRKPIRSRRCLVIADGFYEWKANPGKKTKTPYFIHMKDRNPFAFAGLWDSWESPDGSSLKTCTIITTGPNELMATLHDRMPVILHPRDYAKWLDTSPQTPENLLPLIKPYPAEAMSAHPVSTLVNKPGNDSAELVVPAL